MTKAHGAAEPVTLIRDCSATIVPHGERVSLNAGGVVAVVQQLGGSITVRTEMGTLLRIDAQDADALGLTRTGEHLSVGENEPFDIDQVIDALRTVYDPEIPVSIVDLGLVYRCDEVVLPDGTRRVEIDMSMTAPGCGMGDILCADAQSAVASIPAVDHVEVNLVLDPPWGLDRISESARLQLGLL